jgi:hypothetical protein
VSLLVAKSDSRLAQCTPRDGGSACWRRQCAARLPHLSAHDLSTFDQEIRDALTEAGRGEYLEHPSSKSILSEPNQQIEPAKSAFEPRAAVSHWGGDVIDPLLTLQTAN